MSDRNVFPGVTIIGPLAYRGKKGCQWPTCTRRFDPVTGTPDPDCWGWHCSYCDAPCSSQGHRCDASEAILGEAARQAGVAPPEAKDPRVT